MRRIAALFRKDSRGKEREKAAFIFFAMVMLLSLVACGKDNNDTPPSDEEQDEPTTATAYSVEGFETVDADSNRITTGHDATGTKAMATASKYEISQVGTEIMSKGGNAVDTAIAMGFALGVCEPFTSGLGGGIATIHTADGQDICVDFRDIAPVAATLDLYVDENGKDNGNTRSGGLASGVPGEVAGMLCLLENYGTMSRAEVMEPAIRIATEGFTVSHYCANAISDACETAAEFPEMQKVYWTEDGQPYEEGDVITNPGLARALQKIADEGKDGFYKGEVAQALVDTLAKYGGVMALDSLANYDVQVRKPVTVTSAATRLPKCGRIYFRMLN